MLDDVFKERTAGQSETPRPATHGERFPSLKPLLFPPLVLLLLLGSIIYFFGLLSFDSTSPLDLLREVRTETGERRAVAAYELSRLESYDLPPDERRAFVSLAIETFNREEGGDPRIRRSLALTFGRVGDPRALPSLIGSLEDPDVETQLYGIWALGALRDPRAVDAILPRLAHADPGVRKMAAFALGEIGDTRSIPTLQVTLQDRAEDVTWNAAVALARMGDRSGVPVLLSLLDRRRSAGTAALDPARREEVMINVVRSLQGISDEAVRRALRNLSRNDSSVRVRNEARKALEGKSDLRPTGP